MAGHKCNEDIRKEPVETTSVNTTEKELRKELA
jgi:hypothetical protein